MSKYHTDPTTRLKVIAEKQCNAGSEMHSRLYSLYQARPGTVVAQSPRAGGGRTTANTSQTTRTNLKTHSDQRGRYIVNELFSLFKLHLDPCLLVL